MLLRFDTRRYIATQVMITPNIAAFWKYDQPSPSVDALVAAAAAAAAAAAEEESTGTLPPVATCGTSATISSAGSPSV